MKKQFIENSKYDKIVDEFVIRRRQLPFPTLKSFAEQKNVSYTNLRKATLRRGIELGKCNPDSYTVIQLGVCFELYDKLDSTAKKQKTTIANIVREELKKSLNA